jgi:hypothetical protein
MGFNEKEIFNSMSCWYSIIKPNLTIPRYSLIGQSSNSLTQLVVQVGFEIKLCET